MTPFDEIMDTESLNDEARIRHEIVCLEEALAEFSLYGNPIMLDEDRFSGELSSLAKNLNRLFANYRELKDFSIDLAEGNLTGDLPPRSNWLAGPLKSLHAQMLHLGWQAKQVADGDYSQMIDFMGEFSEAFNRMIGQLSEREKRLTQSQKAMRTVLEHTPNGVIVVDCATRGILFQNEAARRILDSSQFARDDASLRQSLIEFDEEADIHTWELSGGNGALCLSVHSNRIDWLHKAAYLHTLRDITQEKQAEEELRTFAYFDSSTGVGNRNSGMELLGRQLDRQRPFIAVFIDMDGLKYINDTFGHVSGDHALRELAQTLHHTVRDKDHVFRMGGDEFLIVFHKMDEGIADRVIRRVRSILVMKNQQLPYDIEFSVGSYAYDGKEALEAQELLKRADGIMYEEKRRKQHTRAGKR